MTCTYETRVNKDGTTTYSKTVNVGIDPKTGKRRQTRVSAKTVRELKKLWADTIKRIDSGDFVEPSRLTFGDYLAHWLETYGKPNLRATTYRSYEQLIRVHIVPSLGNVLLQKLQPVQLQQFYNDKLSGGRADGGAGGVAPRTVRYLHSIIREALKQAVKWQMVTRNVADATDPPKGKRPPVKAWSAEQARQFLAVAEGDTYGAVWMLAVGTGMRRGELLALRWEDVDLTKGVLHIRRSLVELGSALVFQQPKTASGRRAVQLSRSTVNALKEHRARQNEQRLRAGASWQDGDLVFATALGGPVAPRNLLHRFKELIEEAGVPPVRFHDLRHTHATLLLKEGTHAKIVSERLGHATIAITLDTYSHVLPDMQREAAVGIERALFGA